MIKKIKKNKKVAVAVSGGVDSSAAAFLLQKKGYETIGIFMRLGINDIQSENRARQICQKLGIKFYPINFGKGFKKEVIEYFLDAYRNGLTPNPCVQCNKFIKFGKLFEFARKIGADKVATGHYVKKSKCKNQNAKYKLFRGRDEGKDQSYFLYNLNQEQLKNLIFPLGSYKKKEIKNIVAQAGLPCFEKESQDICFLEGDHNVFLKKHIKMKPGPIKILKNNEVIGEHQGLPLYTIGQRRGVEIGGSGPYYVTKMDYKKNILYVVSDRDDPDLYKKEALVEDVNWVGARKPKLPLDCEVLIRYGQDFQKCSIQPLAPKIKDGYLIKFKKSQRAIMPGQSIVFYKGDEVLGGGVIN